MRLAKWWDNAGARENSDGQPPKHRAKITYLIRVEVDDKLLTERYREEVLGVVEGETAEIHHTLNLDFTGIEDVLAGRKEWR